LNRFGPPPGECGGPNLFNRRIRDLRLAIHSLSRNMFTRHGQYERATASI
jgi:hypothetical protein